MINFRKLHRKSAPIVFLPLLLSALTGVAYRLGRTWFGIPEEVADFFMTIHQGEFLGNPLVPVYVLFVGLGLLGMIVTGFTLIKWQGKAPKVQPKKDWRWFHKFLAPIAFVPLFVSAITGIGYRLGKAWFGLSSEQASILLKIHQGSYLGTTFKVFYVLLVGVSLGVLLITGIQMTGIFRKSRV
ncbi:PepSY domain-containing protein [Phormidium pseudopriestleyi FRX01]|uniref:PepSY domain-containing protein n=1 Tax=Phormidium pseudopriestleyi FRX01 TaxID=1759528 RepID=A0ABS3FMM5_9CYAN|nr:PepSY domain-containing protein [Phormidium pseudopriestleyi]MBO0348346.1 PepSY domain-containing protein [Phormidium pseudopriestleyi FRX01]